MRSRLSRVEIALMVYRAIENFIEMTGVSPTIGGTALRSGLPRGAVRRGIEKLVRDGILIRDKLGDARPIKYSRPGR